MKNPPLWNGKIRQIALRGAAVALWLLLWQAAAMALRQPLLLPAPAAVARRLFALFGQKDFFPVLARSFSRVALGFFCAFALGAALALLAARFALAEALLRPLMLTVKTVPVASFIILALIWLSSRRLSPFIAFLMGLPILYGNLLQGIKSADPQLLEMARVFRAPWRRRLLYIYLPAVKPYLLSACALALGMAWKAGAAAEVIGIPAGTIGEKLYMAKVYVDTGELLAWTAVIVGVSALFEKCVLLLIRRAYRRLEGGV